MKKTKKNLVMILKVKEKSKKLSESESGGRLISQKLAVLEVAVATKNLEDKYKKVNDKLTSKIKEHKKSEARGKERLNTILEKNKKIAELETATTRLNLMKEQANEIEKKSTKKDDHDGEEAKKLYEKKGDDSNERKRRCRFENTGLCRAKSNCMDFHPN